MLLQIIPEFFIRGNDTIPADQATLRDLRDARRNYLAAKQESTAVRRTPEMVGRSYEDPIGDAFRSFVDFLTTPLRRNMGGPSPRDINIQDPRDPHNTQIVDELGPQEDNLIGRAFEADTRSPARRWWESTEFPPVALARGAWDTFVGQATPLDVALEAAGAGLAARSGRGPAAIGGALARPSPTTRGSQSQIMRAYDEAGNIPFGEYGTHGQDIIERMLEEADQATRAPSSGTSIADEAFRTADEATRPPSVIDINTRRGNLDTPEGGSLMGRGPLSPEEVIDEFMGPQGYTPEGGSLLDDALSGNRQRPTPEDLNRQFIEEGGVLDEVDWDDPLIRRIAEDERPFPDAPPDIGDVLTGRPPEELDDLIEEALLWHDSGSSIEDVRKAYGDDVADIVEGEVQYRRDENPLDDAFDPTARRADDYPSDQQFFDAIEDFRRGLTKEDIRAMYRRLTPDQLDQAYDLAQTDLDVGDLIDDAMERNMRGSGGTLDDALDAPEYLDDPGSPDAIEAAQERQIEEQLQAWHDTYEDPIQDAFDGLSKSELKEKYPDLDNRTLDEILEYKRQEDDFESMLGSEEDYLEGLRAMEEEGIIPPGSADDLLEDLFSPEERTRIDLTGGGDEIDRALANNPPIEEPPFETPLQEGLYDLFPPGPSSFTQNERDLVSNYLDMVSRGDMTPERATREAAELLRPQAVQRLSRAFQRALYEADQTGEVFEDIIQRELRRL